MSKKAQEELTELRQLRKQYNISVKELCEEINMATGYYYVLEKGSRKYAEERYEKFYYQVAHALEKLYKQKLKSAQLLNHTNQGLTLHNHLDILAQQVQSEEQDTIEEAFDVEYPPITEDKFKQALMLLKKGRNLIQISIQLEVCEWELENLIGSMHRESNSKDLAFE